MSKNIAISLMDDNNIEHVIEFYNKFNKTNRSITDFTWEFKQAPAGKAIYVIAKDADNNRIVGTQCAIPIHLYTYAGEVILSAKSEDTLVDPEYRGLNIFERMYELLLAECKASGIKYIWGFTTAKKPFFKLDFQIPFAHSQSVMVRDVLPAYLYLKSLNAKNDIMAKTKIMVLCILSKLRSIKSQLYSKETNNYSIKITEKHTIEDTTDIALNIDNESFTIKQDLDYITWRLINNPYHGKVFNVYFKVDSKVVGSVSLNYHKGGVWYLINELYSKNLSDKVKISMLKESLRLLFKKEKGNVSLIRTWDFCHNPYGIEEIKRRKCAGFIHLNRGIPFVWKRLDEKGALDVNGFILSRIASQGVI